MGSELNEVESTVLLLCKIVVGSVGEVVGEKNPRTLLVGMQASATTLEKNLEAS
jgi:hypothetical protein